MNKAYLCPKCKKYILQSYCFACKIDVTKINDNFKDFFPEDTKDLFESLFGNKNR